MSVLACDRNGCDNVMCDHFIADKYVCRECLSEFEQLQLEDAGDSLPMDEWQRRLVRFIGTPKVISHVPGSGTLSEFIRLTNRSAY